MIITWLPEMSGDLCQGSVRTYAVESKIFVEVVQIDSALITPKAINGYSKMSISFKKENQISLGQIQRKKH